MDGNGGVFTHECRVSLCRLCVHHARRLLNPTAVCGAAKASTMYLCPSLPVPIIQLSGRKAIIYRPDAFERFAHTSRAVRAHEPARFCRLRKEIHKTCLVPKPAQRTKKTDYVGNTNPHGAASQLKQTCAMPHPTNSKPGVVVPSCQLVSVVSGAPWLGGELDGDPVVSPAAAVAAVGRGRSDSVTTVRRSGAGGGSLSASRSWLPPLSFPSRTTVMEIARPTWWPMSCSTCGGVVWCSR